MKKRVLSVLLAIALLIAVGIIAAQADPEYTPEQIVTLSAGQTFTGTGPVEAPCYACGGEMKVWQPLTAITDGSATVMTEDHYFVAEDITHGKLQATAGKNICLHLNGKNVTYGAYGSAIVGSSGTLNIMGNTTIWGGATNLGVIDIDSTGAINIYGAKLRGHTAATFAAQSQGGTINFYDVDVLVGMIRVYSYNKPSSLNFYSGDYTAASDLIVLCDASYNNDASVAIHGGQFGAITAGAEITVTGGTVAALNCGSFTSAINISGNPKISAVDLSASPVKLTVGTLTQGASIGLGTTSGVFTEPFATPEAAEAAKAYFNFTSDATLSVTGNKELSLATKEYTVANTIAEKVAATANQRFTGAEAVTDYCYVCNKPVTWEPITAATHIAASGHYFLANDITATNDNALYIWSASAVTACVQQNGKTITQPASRNQQAIAGLKANGILNLMGGGLIECTSSYGTVRCQAGEINIYGGTIENHGGRQHCVQVQGGTVGLYGVTATTLGVSAESGILNIESGNINNLIVTGCQVNLSGAPTVAALDMSAATTKIDAKGLTGGSINVSAVDGVFTTPFDSDALAKAAIPFFVGGSKTVSATDEYALKCEAKTYDPANTIAEKIEKSNAQRFEGTAPVDDYCYVCNKPVTWQPITGAGVINAAGHYFLTDSIEGSGDHTVYTWGSNATVCLHLNGKTLSATGAGCAAFASYDADTSVNLIGGTLTSEATNVGAVYCHAAAATNIYGCTVVNTGGNRRSVYADNANGTANIYGVDTSDNYIYATTGAIKMESGSCRGLIIGANVTSAKVSGAPTIAAVDLSAATVKLDATGLTGGRIGLGETEGVFTTAFETTEKAEAASAFFTTPSLAVVVVDKQLTTAEAAAAIVTANGQKAYESYAAAEAAYTDGYIKMFVDNDIVVTKNVTIDLNGQHIDASGSGVLTVMDSKTYQNYAAEPGSIVVTAGDVTVEAPATQTAQDGTVSGYLPVTEGGMTTFTYFTMKLSGVALRANKQTVGLYYKGTWNFNDYLLEGKVEAGVVVNVLGAPAAGFRDVEANGYFAKDAATVINGQPVTSVLVDGIMKAEGREPATNSQYGQTKINAAAFVTVNGVDILTEIKSLSVKDILEMFEKDENIEQYNKMETKLANFYTAWKDLANLEAWGLTKIGK